MELWRGVITHYREFLPVSEATPVVTLNEGNTPLIETKNLAAAINPVLRLFLKFEGANPTGSFKDRGMTLAISKAAEAGAAAVICASTGNTSASAAAYAVRHGLSAVVVVPAGNIAMGKLAQAVAHGATIVAIDGSFDNALQIVRDLSERHPVALVNSVNPHRIEGQKTAAFEIADELGTAPDLLCIPVGNAGNITAYWRGFTEYYRMERIASKPRMWGFQAAGAAPLVSGERVAKPETIATAIRIGNPASWDGAIAARDESEGAITAVTDDEILNAYRRMARDEGIFCEPASAASVAGLLRRRAEGEDLGGLIAVCIITGAGLKDPDTALGIEARRLEAAGDTESVERALGW
jgi:threonine synthase